MYKTINNKKKQRIYTLGSSCTQELQTLFGCLKKWEFDDKPCSKQHSLYMDCVHESQRAAEEFNRAAKEGKIGEGQGAMTTAQFNKLMKLFPQPDLGQAPYRQMKRLPTQPYSSDIFHRKGWKGKPS
uniref:CHCH domain-containing protein n=1 Tax=Heterorhabditis bacteriophora TaxID=37862 RepID=A0A1I7WMQ7_HETBA